MIIIFNDNSDASEMITTDCCMRAMPVRHPVSKMQSDSVTTHCEITTKDNVCVCVPMMWRRGNYAEPRLHCHDGRKILSVFPKCNARKSHGACPVGVNPLDSRQLLYQVWRENGTKLLKNVADRHIQPAHRLHTTYHNYIILYYFILCYVYCSCRNHQRKSCIANGVKQ